jgi:hypothetical protein
MSEDKPSESEPVPGYAGHADAIARRLTDQQVRAHVGEILADLADRLPIDAVRERYDALLMRCEFANQHVIRAIEVDRFAEPAAAAAVEEYDRKLVAAAEACKTVDAGGLPACLDGLERAFDERGAGIEALLKTFRRR